MGLAGHLGTVQWTGIWGAGVRTVRVKGSRRKLQAGTSERRAGGDDRTQWGNAAVAGGSREHLGPPQRPHPGPCRPRSVLGCLAPPQWAPGHLGHSRGRGATAGPGAAPSWAALVWGSRRRGTPLPPASAGGSEWAAVCEVPEGQVASWVPPQPVRRGESRRSAECRADSTPQAWRTHWLPHAFRWLEATSRQPGGAGLGVCGAGRRGQGRPWPVLGLSGALPGPQPPHLETQKPDQVSQ